MKSIILAAGYATRLYPLTRNFPKPLLDVQGKTILDRLVVDQLEHMPAIDEHIIVTNHKFAAFFTKWRDERRADGRLAKPTAILDDGSTDNENRLGAVTDLIFALDTCRIKDDVCVLAGDNVLDFDLQAFADYFSVKKTTVIMRHFQPDTAKLQKTGVIKIDNYDKVLLMQEKPEHPVSNWAVPPFYIYPESVLPELKKGIAAGCATDAPGDFIAWFCRTHPVHAWLMSGNRYDVGDLHSYETIQHIHLEKK